MLLYVTYLTSSRVLFVSPPPPSLSLSLPLSFRLSPLFHICYYRTLADKRKGSSCRYGTQLDRNATVQSPLRTTEELWGSSWCLTSLMKNHSKLWEDGKKEKEKGGWGRGEEREREREGERERERLTVGEREEGLCQARVNIDCFVVPLYTTFFPTHSCMHYLFIPLPFSWIIGHIWSMNNYHRLVEHSS